MHYLRFVAFACLLITGLFASAQSNNTDRLVTKSGTLWEGRIVYDTAGHSYTVFAKDSIYKFAENDVREIVRNGKPQMPGKKQNDDYEEFAPEQKEQPTYHIPYSPDRLNYPDYVISKKGDLYEGWVVEDKVKDHVIMRLKDSTTITIPYSNIRRVNYSNYTWASMNSRKAKERKPVDLPHMHNVGLGLTIAGSVLIAGGIPLIATAPYTTTRTSTSVVARSTSGAAVVGVLFELLGVPILIPGIVKLAKYAHLMKKQQKSQPGNL
jgi:hypothetical protein